MNYQQIDMLDTIPAYSDDFASQCFPEWGGLRIGGYASINVPVVDMVDGGAIYAYMETVKLMDLVNREIWICEIDMGDGWEKNGIRCMVNSRDLWVPIRILNGSQL
jgi:hypothetical protein